MGEVPDPPQSAVAALERLLQDKDEHVRRNAAEALKKIKASEGEK
jgi:HEAT repeat protein